MTFHNTLTMVDHKTFIRASFAKTLRQSIALIALIAALCAGPATAQAQCTVFDVGGGGAYCTGGTGVTITLSGSESGVSYQLKNGVTNVQAAKAGTGSALTWTNVTSVGTLTIVANKSTAPTCSATMNGSADVTANPLLALFTTSGTGAICSGDPGLTITLDGSATGVNYQLRRGATLVGDPVAGTGSPLTWTNIATAGTYTVVAADATTNCGRTMTGNAVITVNALPTNRTLSGAGIVCAGGPGRTLTLNGSQTTATYQLRIDGVDAGAPVAGTGSPLTWTDQTTAGTYTVVATMTATGCIRIMNGSPVITVNPYPLTYDIGGGGTICSGATTTITLSNSESGVTYQLKNGATNVQGGKAGTGSPLTWVNVNTAGTYTIVGTRTGCAVTMNGTATVNVNPLPALFTVSGSGTICSGAPGLTVTLDGSQTGVNYQLRRGATLVGSPQAGTGSELTWTGNTTAGTYTVLATDATTSCVRTMTGSAVITVNPLPTAYNVGGTGGVCDGGAGRNITLSNSQATVSYQLRLNGVDLGAPVTGTGAALAWANQTAAGAYTVVGTNSTTGCVRQMNNTATITVNPMPALFNVTGGNVCVSGSITVGLDGSATGVRYQLQLNGVNLGAYKNGTGSALTWGNQTTAGTYTIIATIPSTGCNRPMTGSAGINPLPIAFNVTGGGASCPGGNGVTISLSDSETGVTYQLRLNGNPVDAPKSGTGDSLNWVNQATAGVYTVTAVNAATSCTQTMTGSATVVDEVPSVFSVTGGGYYITPPGVTIGLSGSEVGVNYQVFVDGLLTGPTKIGTGSALSWADQQREGTYTVTATHATTLCVSEMNGFATVSAAAAWTNKGGVTEGSGALVKTVGSGWGNAGAISMNRLDSGRNGSLSFAATSGRFILGFASSTANFSYSSIDYGFELDNGQLTIVESGTKFSMGAYVTDDSLSIARVGSSIIYYKNGVELRTIAGDSLRTYRIKSSIYSNGSPAVITSFAKVPTGETNPSLAELPSSQIPDDVKPIRKNIPVAAPLERQFLLRDLTQGDTLDVFEAPPCLEGNYNLAFQLYYDLGDKNTTIDWSAFLELQLLHGEDTLWTKPLLNEMTTQTFIGTVFHNALVSCDGDYRLVINRKNVEGNAPEENIYMKILLFKHMEDVFSPSANLQLNCSYDDNETLLGWNYSGKAVIEYDIEWVFIDDHDVFPGSTAQDAFAFKEPVRISTASPYYTHQVYYPAGRVWYRARAVGYNPQYPDHRIPGQWFYSPCSAITISNHQPDITWQEQTVFAEEGKHKKVMSYFDGTQRQRQVQTNLSTEQVTLVGESMYDFEGRKSVDMLAVPATDHSLTYRPGFNQFDPSDATVTANTSASRHKFHYDNYRLTNSIMANTTGAGKYYSSNNDQAGIHRDYIPDAAGFVYTQTEYMNDGTGRVRRQSGLGQEFNIDGIRTTRYFYGNAAPSELIRLFGTNVGNASHYKKNLLVDPNGQVSVSYLDQEGRTIATALAGDPPSNVDSLQSYKDLDPAPITVDISSKNKKDDYVSQISHKILNAVPNTNYTFHYDLSAYASQVEEFGCQTCSFDLKITITDPDGTPVDLSSAAGNESTDGLSYARNNISAESCSSPTFVNDVDFTIPFAEIGDYTVTKTVTPHELTFEQMQQLVQADENVQQQINEIRQGYTQDPADCEVCTSGPEAEAAINQAINEVAEQDCENIYQQIIQHFTQLYSASVDTVYVVPQDSIEAHPLYCKYQLCAKNKASDAFEKQYNRIANWDAAVSAGYTNLVDIDPFFNNGELSGYNYKSAMLSKLADEYVATVGYDNNGDSQVDGETVYSGPIDQITNPLNTAMYVDSRGNPDPVNGKHLLYIDLMGRRSALGETSYQQQLSEQRWEQYKSFYTESKRKTKMEIPEYSSCASAMEELQGPDNFPSTEEEITALGESYPGPVTNADLETTLQGLKSKCNTTFSPSDSTAIAGHLQTYLNARPSNFFRLILRPDLGVDPDLIAIQGILNGYSCGLDSIALDDPIMCAKDTTITISAYTQGVNQMMLMAVEGPGMQRMMAATEPEKVKEPGNDTPFDTLGRSNAERLKKEWLEKAKLEKEKLRKRDHEEYRSGTWNNVSTDVTMDRIVTPPANAASARVATQPDKSSNDPAPIDSVLAIQRDKVLAQLAAAGSKTAKKKVAKAKAAGVKAIKKDSADTTKRPAIDKAKRDAILAKAKNSVPDPNDVVKAFEKRREEEQKRRFASIEKALNNKGNKTKSSGEPAAQQGAQKNSFGILSAPLPTQAEYDALIALYNYTDGPNWYNNTGWSTADPNTIEDVSTWYGVTVDFQGHISQIALSSNNLNGDIPAEFNDLDWIQYIWLSSNNIQSLPENFGAGWDRLQLFYIEYNPLGELPESFGDGWINVFDIHMQALQLTSLPESFGTGWARLRTLWLDYNELSDLPPAFSNNEWPIFYQVFLRGNRFTSLPEDFGSGWPFLDGIMLDNNQLTSLPANFGSAWGSNFFSIFLPGNQLTSLPANFGATWTNLYSISLSYNALTSLPSGFGSTWSAIGGITINNNQLTSLPPSFDTSMSTLYYFDASDNPIGTLSSSFGSSMTGMESLFLNNTGLTSLPPTFETGFPTLSSLYLRFNNFGTLPATFGDGFNNINYVGLEGSGLTSLPAGFGENMSTLTYIGLNSNPLGTLPSDFGDSWTNLTGIGLSGCELTALPATFGDNWSQMMNVALSMNQLTTLPSTLGNTWTQLSSFEIAGNYITEIPAAAFSVWPATGALSIGSNRLTFDDILPALVRYPVGNVYYYNQDFVETPQTLQATLGAPFVLSANVDRSTSPASIYQWFRNGVAITPADAGSHTVNISSFSYDDLGIYYYTITNPDVADLTLTSYNQNVTADCATTPQEEYDAMMSFFNSTNGTEWTNSTGWGAPYPADFSTWYGVEVDGNNHVISISLPTNNVIGPIPSDIASLCYLQTLNLRINQITGEIPTSVGIMSNLETLDLIVNQVTGSLPPTLGSLSNLSVLLLSNNQLSGSIPTELGSLSSLTNLQMASNTLSGNIPYSLGDLTQLEFLELGFNQLTGVIPPTLGNLSNLRTLNVGVNQLVGYIPTELGDLSNLETLQLFENDLSGPIPSSFANLTNLSFLQLESNELTGNVPAFFGDLPNLTYLGLHENQLDGPVPSELANSTSITSLLLGNNELSGTIPTEIWTMSTLNTLTLGGNHLDGVFPQNIDNLPNLQVLDLYGCQLTGTLPAAIGNCPDLFYLVLSHNELTGTIPEEFGNLTHLFGVYMEDNHLTGPVPAGFANSPGLYYLALNDNELSGPVPPAIGNVIQGYFLLDQNKLTFSDILPILANMTTTFTYYLQDSVDVRKHITGQLGEQIVLTADVDRTTSPASKYQWFLNGNPVTDIDADNYSYTIASLSEATAGDYYYQIINDDAPDLTLTSRLQTLLFNYECNSTLEDEYNALMALYNSTNGAEWQISTNWGTAFPTNVGDWYGVRTNVEGHVISLKLEANGLFGTLPVEIGQLCKLDSLDLAYNYMPGGLPSSIASLQELRYLMLSGVGLGGDLPTSLGAIASLQYADLWGNQFTGTVPPELGDLVNLRYLQLGANTFTGSIPSQLGQLDKLKTLGLYGNQLSGAIPVELASIDSLEWIDLSYNQLTGSVPSEFGNLPVIEIIDFSNNQLTGPIPSELGDLSTLESLYLNYNSFSGNIPVSLSYLPNLVNLHLYSNQLSGNIPPELGNSPQLKSLYISFNQLTGSIPAELGQISTLEGLAIGYNQLTGSIPSELGNCTQLNYLDGFNNSLSGSLPASLGNCTNMQYLSFGNNLLTGTLPVEYGNFTQLMVLLLYNNQIGGEIPAEYGNMTSLIQLYLSGNQLTGSIPVEMGNLSSLQYFDVAGNLLTGSIPVELSNLTNLRELYLYSNDFSGTIPLELNDVPNIYRIYLYNNDYTMTELLPTITDFSNVTTYIYYPQDSVDVNKFFTVPSGATQPFDTNIDIATDPASKYQWFKDNPFGADTPMQPSPTTGGHAFTLNNVGPSDAGKYYYTITNDNVPYLTLVSHVQFLIVQPPLDSMRTINICLENNTDLGTNPTLAAFTFTVDWNEEVQKCMANAVKQDSILTEYAIAKFVEERATSYYNSYRTNCLSGLTEHMDYRYVNKEYHYTLYYFDQSGSLVQTVAPTGVHPLTPTQVSTFLAGTHVDPEHGMLTRYRYSSVGHIVTQITPDAGRTDNLIDKKGRIRVGQNAQQFLEHKFSYSKYDLQGRTIEVGEFDSPQLLSDFTDDIELVDFPSSNNFVVRDRVLSHYDFPDSAITATFLQENVRNRLSWVEAISGVDTIKTHYSYDPIGHVQSVLQKLPGLEEKRFDYLIDMSGQISATIYQQDEADQFVHRYTRDPDNRISLVETSIDGFIWNKEANYSYYQHGPLARIELGEYRVQGLDYYYTVRGSIKGVNMPYIGDPGNDGLAGNLSGKDVMAYSVGYYESDYLPLGNVLVSGNNDEMWTRQQQQYGNNGLFNGNLSWMITDLGNFSSQSRPRESGMQAVLYRHDQLNRLIKTRALPEYSTANGFVERETEEAYDEDYSYDANGNILNLKRRDRFALPKDEFTYAYYENTNRLKTTEIAGDTIYVYDANGNLVGDRGKNILIEWTPQGKIRKITGPTSHVSYLYDGTGNRVRKHEVKDSIATITTYVRDGKGGVVAIYKDSAILEQAISGHQRLGNYLGKTNRGYRTLGRKRYELANHLGNVLTVVTDNIQMKADSVWAIVASSTDYYAFGLAMEGRNFSDSVYRYGFNGKEKDQNKDWGTTNYDYGFRIYNPSIGKFLSVDPLTKSYPWYSPYQFAGNMPIVAVDLDGLEPANAMTGKRIEMGTMKELNALKSNQYDLWRDMLQWEKSDKYKSVFDEADKGRILDEQEMNWAFGDWLNTDYYALNITKLPTGYTMESLYDHLRKNFNDYMDSRISTLEPHLDFTSEDLWNSSDPTGAVMTFNSYLYEFIQIDDAAVLTSQAGPTHWIFTPVGTAWDWEHPLAGHRQFGLSKNSDGTFTFYTRGVDMMWDFEDWLYNLDANWPLPQGQDGDFFKDAEQLWNKVMENVVDFINKNGGSATKTHNFSRRINWNTDVKDEDK